MLVLRLTEVVRARTSISVGVSLGDLRFQIAVWYEDVDLHALAREHGEELLERLAVHVALFQINAVASLRPDVIDLGPYAKHLTPALATLWHAVFRNAWAQWRYEHELPDYAPRFASEPVAPSTARARVPDGPIELLAFCGGGKDSLVALRLLERAELPYATLAYSHSIYGRADPQHELIERVAAATGRARRERLWIVDDILDSPVCKLRPELGATYVLAAETPASLFAALPLALARGYRGLVVAHEASANVPQLIVDGLRINHQWGKSWEAEQLLDRYVRDQLFENLRYFSVLAPVHDEVVLELLSRDPGLAHLTHSCNIEKPWCRRCDKCVYVWLQFAAHLPAEVVERTFGSSLAASDGFGRPLRRLLGLGSEVPFECVGSVPEARLAFWQARAREAFEADLRRYDVPAVDARAIDAAPYVQLGTSHGMPAHVAERVMPLLDEAARAAADRLVAAGFL